MNGVYLRFYTREDQRVHGILFYVKDAKIRVFDARVAAEFGFIEGVTSSATP